jgi:hypothetical protein
MQEGVFGARNINAQSQIEEEGNRENAILCFGFTSLLLQGKLC